MTDKVKLIKEEIERLDEEYRTLRVEGTTQQAKEADLVVHVLQKLENIIDSIPEEHNEDLEEEIQRAYYDKSLYDADNLDRQDFNNIARHFTEWQEKKMLGIAEAFYEQGRFEQKQEMMKDAVEGIVKYEIGSAEIPQCDRRYQVLSDPTPIANAKLGDKVKIIILKTEQQ